MPATHMDPDAVDEGTPADLRASLAQRGKPFVVGRGIEAETSSLQPVEEICPAWSVRLRRRDDMDVLEIATLREGQLDEGSSRRVDGKPVDVLRRFVS